MSHWGYQEGEVPRYEECECGQTIRIDRLDLIQEHLDTAHGQREDTSDKKEVRTRRRWKRKRRVPKQGKS